MKNPKAGASLRSKCLAILHCLVFALCAQPTYAKRPISKPPEISAEVVRLLNEESSQRNKLRYRDVPQRKQPVGNGPIDQVLKPLGLDPNKIQPASSIGKNAWKKALEIVERQPRLTPKNVAGKYASDPSINIDPRTLEMCRLQPNQRLRMCLAIEEAAELYRRIRKAEEIVNTEKDAPNKSVPHFVGNFFIGAAMATPTAKNLAVAATPAGPVVMFLAGAGTVIGGGVTYGITAQAHREGEFKAAARYFREKRKEVSEILQVLVRNGVYSESLCLSYNGVVKISERGEMICYRKNTDSSKSANQFNLASLADAHGKVCQELYGKKAAPARYVLGNKIVCSVNNKYEVVKGYTLADLINECKMTGKKVGEAATKVCTDFIAGMKKPKTEIHALSNSTGTGQKADATSPRGTSTTGEQNIASMKNPKPNPTGTGQKTDATSPRGTNTTGEQNIADQVAKIIGTAPAQKSQTGNPLSPERTTESMKKLKHQMILEAIKQEREYNKMTAENFEKLIKAKIEDARRDTEFHQKVHEFLLKKMEYDALEHQEKMIRHEQYIREQQERIRSIQQLIHPGRFHSIKQQQHLGAQR